MGYTSLYSSRTESTDRYEYVYRFTLSSYALVKSHCNIHILELNGLQTAESKKSTLPQHAVYYWLSLGLHLLATKLI